MKKILLLLLLLSLTLFVIESHAQLKKVDTIELVKNLADKWFITSYVNLAFKDPYSYQPLKTIVIPVTSAEASIDSIKRLTSGYPKNGDKSNAFLSKLWMAEYDYANQTMYTYYKKSHLDNLDKSLDKSKSKSMREYYKKSALSDSIKLEEELVNINQAKRLIDSVKVLIKKIENNANLLPLDKQQVIVYYKIYHDCYGSNSYGNKILGRYVYHFYLSKGYGEYVTELK